MKKILNILIIPIILLSFCINVFAETIYTEDTLKYIIKDNEVVIVKYFGTEEEVTIPRTINSMPVTTIASGAFVDTYAKKVIIPDSVVYVEAGAFSSSVEYNWDDELIEPKTDDSEKTDDNPRIDNNEGQIEELPVHEINEITENGEVDVNGDIVANNETNSEIIDEENITTTKPSKIEKSVNINPVFIVFLVFLVVVVVLCIIKIVKKNNDRNR